MIIPTYILNLELHYIDNIEKSNDRIIRPILRSIYKNHKKNPSKDKIQYRIL